MSADSDHAHDEHKHEHNIQQQTAQPEAGALSGAVDSPGISGAALGDHRLDGRGNGVVRAAVMRQAQQTYGNRAVGRHLQRSAARSAQSTPPALTLSRQAESSAPQTPAADAEGMLNQAISIVEGALAAATGRTNSSGPATTNSSDPNSPQQSEASSRPQATAEQISQLEAALSQLLGFRGSGRNDEIRAACEPIVQSAQGSQAGAAGANAAGAPVQRAATLVMGAPLLAGGPPGWAVYAGLVVFTLVVTGVVVYESSRARDRTNDDTRADPRVVSRRDETMSHMGNIHIQGDDISGAVPNYAWNRSTPMTKVEALAALAALRGMLSTRQVGFRDTAFIRASAFINTTMHMAPPPLFRTFQNPNVRDDPRLRTRRVDIEIIRGGAFV